jgi:hypothetical protein
LELIELKKNAADEDATIWSAYAQLRRTKRKSGSLATWLQRGVDRERRHQSSHVGSVTANQECWFKGMADDRWRRRRADVPELGEVLVRRQFEATAGTLDLPALHRLQETWLRRAARSS